MRSEEESIRQLVATRHEATTAGDVSRILPLMTDDVVFLVPGPPPMRGRKGFAEGLKTVLRHHRIASKSEKQEIQVSGDLACFWSALSFRITPLAEGSPMRRTWHALTILGKTTDGGWVVVRDANLLASDPGGGAG